MATPIRAITILSAAAALAGAGCGQTGADKAGGTDRQGPTVLVLANGDARPGSLQPFAAAVRRLSGDTLRVEVSNGWRKGTPTDAPEVIADVKAGRVDLAWAGPQAFDGVGVHSFDALLAPLLFETYALQEKVLAGPVARAMLAGLEPLGVIGLGILPGPMRKPTGIDREARSAVVAVPQVPPRPRPIEDQTFAILGPVSVQPGTYPHGMNEYVTTNLNLWPRAEILFMNRRTFASLGAAQRAALRRAAESALPEVLAFERNDEEQWARILCRSGLSFVRPTAAQLARLRRRVQPVYDRLARDALTKRMLAQITALRDADTATAGSDAPACAPSGTQPRVVSGRTALDGAYEMTTTRHASARATGDPEPASESYGRWRLTLDRGQFDYTQASEGHERWAKGTYTVTGDTMTWRITAYGGEAPSGDTEKTGESFTFRWSLFRDLLTLKPVAGKASPARLRVRPWRRVTDAP